MYMNFDSFAFECRVSFELMAFIGISIAMNLATSVCTIRKLHEKMDRILDGHGVACIQTPQKPPAAKEGPATPIRAPPAQPAAPGGARLHAILNKLPAHLTALIAAPSERLAEEFASTQALEDALTGIYAAYPAGHADGVFEGLAQDVLAEFAQPVQGLLDRVVFRVTLRYDGLCVEHMQQRARRDAEDPRRVRAGQAGAGEVLERFRGRVVESCPRAQRPVAASPAAALGYADAFDSPNAWDTQA